MRPKARLSPLCIVDSFACGWIVGDCDQAIAVHLYADARPVAMEYAGLELPEGAYPICGRPPANAIGYAVALPAQVMDGFTHDLHVVLTGTVGGDLHGNVLTFRSGPVCGEVQQRGRLYMGTVWFAARPIGPTMLRVDDGLGTPLHSLPLHVSLELEAQGYPARFAIPCETLPDEMLQFSCEGQTLRGSPCKRTQTLVGVLNEVVDGSLRGWALDAGDWQRPLELQLRVDGKTVTWFRPNLRRPDINAYLDLPVDSLGLVGFALPAPEALLDGQPHWVEVVSADDGQALKNGRQRVVLPRAGIPWGDLRAPPRRSDSYPATNLSTGSSAPLVSVVILNRNGAAVLEALLQSWERHNRAVAAEVIVIDHASTDDSLALLRRWHPRLDLRVLALDRNDSFSASCNLGARHARGKHLLFLNNDIVWLQDALPRMLESLQDPQLGVVGIKLLKAVGEATSVTALASEVQHLGVRFKLNDQGYWPYEITPSLCHDEGEHTPQFVPAVTGAVLLCRKADFEAVGGFDTAYFYGFEDVELCLRLAYRLNKAVLCRNDCVALHRHGHTRLSGREMSVYDGVIRNAQVLESHIGVWVKQAYWRSLVTGDGYITRERLVIGLVVDADPLQGRTTPLVADMLDLGRLIGTELPHARLVMLPPEQDWKNVQNLHVLVVGDLRYDIRTLKHARPDLLTVAWLPKATGAWSQLAWWSAFGSALAPQAQALRISRALGIFVHASSPSQPLGDVLGACRWRLRVAIDDQAGEPNRANALMQQVRADGLPCWILQTFDGKRRPPMADVCITVRKGTVGTSAVSRVEGVLHLQWSGDRTGGSIARWLQQQMEACIGSTFRSS